MPPATKRNCCVLLFDCNSQTKEKALQTAMKICCTKFFSASKDVMKLILMNTTTTNNRLNDRFGGYENINECMANPTIYNPKFVLDYIEEAEPAQGNWIEALAVSLKSLIDDFEQSKGTITLQLLFITDLSTPIASPDAEKIQEVIRSFTRDSPIFLYIVGPDIEVPFTIKRAEDVRSWMNKINLKVDETNENLKVAKQIVTNTARSVLCDYKVGVHLFSLYKNWAGTQPWNVPLSVGTSVQIPAQTMRALKQGVECKLTSNERQMAETIWVNAGDVTETIPNENLLKGISRHGKFIEILDNKMFQCENPRSFNVLCFTDSINVPEHIMTGDGSYFVLPSSSSPEDQECLTILIDCLALQNKYVIARRVYNNNGIPKFVVLVPRPEKHPKCFILTELPYAEDVKLETVEKDVRSCLKSEIATEVTKFLDSLDVDSETCRRNVPIMPNMMDEGDSQRIVNEAANKYLEKYIGLHEIDINYFNEQLPQDVHQAFFNLVPDRDLVGIKTEGGDGDSNSDEEFDW